MPDVITDTVEVLAKPGLSITQKLTIVTLGALTGAVTFVGLRKVRKSRKSKTDQVDTDTVITPA